MLNKKIEKFLEANNMNYLYLLLAELEVKRLNSLPLTIREKFEKKITEIALEHVAMNDIPDFLIDYEEESEEDFE